MVKSLNIFFEYEGEIYYLTFSTPLDDYDDVVPDIDMILNSFQVGDFEAAETEAPPSSPVPTSTQEPTATLKTIYIIEIIDPPNDISAAHIDVTKFTYEISGETLSAVLYLRDVPEELTFNRPGVPNDTQEYAWQVSIDIDNDQKTGEKYFAIGSEYSLSISYFADTSNPNLLAAIEDEVQANVWEFDPSDDGWSVIGPATIYIDPEADTISLTGEIPGLTSDAWISFFTYDYKAGADE